MKKHLDPNRPEPAPRRQRGPRIWDLVMTDMKARDRMGRRKYGTALRAHDGRDPLVDAYQEALDLAVYLRKAIEERRDVVRLAVAGKTKTYTWGPQ